MSASTEQRKLAAILPLCGTDMVGYRVQSQRNEALALRSVPEGRQRIAQRFIAGLDGRTTKVPQGRKKLVRVGERVEFALSPPRA